MTYRYKDINYAQGSNMVIYEMNDRDRGQKAAGKGKHRISPLIPPPSAQALAEEEPPFEVVE